MLHVTRMNSLLPVATSLPFFTEPRNLEMAKFMGVRWQEARHVGF